MRSKRSTLVRFLRGQTDAPGSAGVPPASFPRCPCRPSRPAPPLSGREESHGSVPDMIRDGGAGPGCARTGAGGTPALPGGPPPTLLLHKEARAGLPGRSPADAAEPSCLVALRDPSCHFVDHSWFRLFQVSAAPPARPPSLQSEESGGVVPEDILDLGVAEALGPAGPLE